MSEQQEVRSAYSEDPAVRGVYLHEVQAHNQEVKQAELEDREPTLEDPKEVVAAALEAEQNPELELDLDFSDYDPSVVIAPESGDEVSETE